MPIIPYQPSDLSEPHELVSAIRKRRGGELLNLDRMLLHSPAFATAWNHFLGTVRGALTVPGQLRELVICAVAVLNDAEYEFIQHAPEFLKEGGQEEQLERLKQIKDTAISKLNFQPKEETALQLCLEMTRNIKVSDATLTRAAKILDSHQQLVELIGIIATYNMVSRFLVALHIEPEQKENNE